MWSELKPTGLPRKRHVKPSEWFFALYCEAPSDRGDGQWYQAILFRNADRSIYGIKEWLGPTIPHHYSFFDKLAAKIIRDNALRQSLVSVDPDLPDMWKRH